MGRTTRATRWLTGAATVVAIITCRPAAAAITSMNTTNDSSTITYAFQFASASPQYYHAYIDCDNSYTTGYQTGFGVGADYLIEGSQFGSQFLKWVGPGFNWTTAGAGPLTSSTISANNVVWTFPRTNLQSSPCSAGATSAKVVFEVTSSASEVSLLLTHTYLASSSGLTNDRTTNDGSNVYYRMQYSGTWTHYHVFIDTDQNVNTGYRTGGIGADYFIEDGNLRHHPPGNQDWVWDPPTPVTSSIAGGLATWTVPRAAMAETQTDERADIVYHVQDATNTVTVTLPRRTHYYFGGTGLPKPLPAQAMVPLYVRPDTSTAWSDIITAHNNNPSVGITVIANPGNGPGPSADSVYTTAITNLRSAGIRVAGYVDTARGLRNPVLVDADVDNWKLYYPNVDGIFYDLMNVDLGGEGYYQQRTAHAKLKGFSYTIANPGQNIPPTYFGTVDILMVYEHTGTSTALTNWWASYPRDAFAVLAHDVPTMDTTFIAGAKQRVGYVYLTDESQDIYSRLSSYFSSLLTQLAIAPAP